MICFWTDKLGFDYIYQTRSIIALHEESHDACQVMEIEPTLTLIQHFLELHECFYMNKGWND